MWKIIGLLESRGGDVEFLPEWAIGSPNAFQSQTDANTVAEGLQSHVDRLRDVALRKAPGVGGAAPALRYLVLPSIDAGVLAQLQGGGPIAPAQPPVPTISFSGAPPRQ